MSASAHRVRAGRALIAAGLAVVLALSGCSAAPQGDPTAAPQSEPTATPEETSAMVAVTRVGAAIAGTGAALPPGIALPIPDGDFHSMTLDVDCDGGAPIAVGVDSGTGRGFTIQNSTCGDTATLQWPLVSNAQAKLVVVTRDDVAWSVTPSFSTAEFLVDPVIAAECAEYSTVYSSILNADVGYAHYDDVDEAQWSERIDTASDALDDLAEGSSSRLAEPFAEIAAILRSPQRVPGAILALLEPASGRISEICGANQSQVEISADYGA